MKTETRYCYTCGADKEFQILAQGEKFVAWGSSHVVARESSHVEAWGSSHVEARESSHVVARGSSHVVASKFVSCHIHGKKVHVKGGVKIVVPEIATAKEWCDFYGVEIKKGVAVLFKGVDDDFSTENARPKKIFYKPGETPTAPDWDGGKDECGGGLHFSPTPGHTLAFNSSAKHFIACPVKVSTIKVHKGAQYPAKVKAPGLCSPCYEVNRQGERIA